MSESKDTLYGITKEFKELEIAIMNEGGEITADHEQIMIRLESALVKKTDGIVGFVKESEDRISAFDERIAELTEARNKISKGLEKFNNYVVDCMNMRELKEINGEFYTIKLRKPSQIVNITDESKIPADFINTTQKIITKVDKTKIKNALKNGELINGAELANGKQSVNYKAGK